MSCEHTCRIQPHQHELAQMVELSARTSCDLGLNLEFPVVRLYVNSTVNLAEIDGFPNLALGVCLP